MGSKKEKKNSMKILTAHEIKSLLSEGKDKYMIVHQAIKNGQTFIVERCNKDNIIGRVRRSVIHDFNTQPCSVPLQFYEFTGTETFAKQIVNRL
jgi:hypothetical protein